VKHVLAPTNFERHWGSFRPSDNTITSRKEILWTNVQISVRLSLARRSPIALRSIICCIHTRAASLEFETEVWCLFVDQLTPQLGRWRISRRDIIYDSLRLSTMPLTSTFDAS
jgi:hypothetical protein